MKQTPAPLLRLLQALSLLAAISVSLTNHAHAANFVPLFDGTTLEGWSGNPKYWSVVDGAIVGSTKPEGRQGNTFLIAQGEYSDFILRARFKLVNGASGIQFHSRIIEGDEPYLVTGYQADIGGGDTGTFYEEKGRGTLVQADRKIVEAHLKKDDWNQYDIKMQGDAGELRINGHLTARYQESDPEIPRTGLIALQLQAGAGMEIAFKDIEIRVLKEQAQAGAPRPNIILIMADDLGFSDLGCYGSEIDTPNLDRLAEGGMRFTQFYNNAKCAPSRASLLTGLYPQQTNEGDADGRSLNLAQVLKSAGYRTLMTGRSGGLADIPVRVGFDHFFGVLSACCNYFNPGVKRAGENEPGRKYPGEQRAWGRDEQVMKPFTPKNKDFYATDAFTETAIEYLEEFGTKKKPFFLYLPYTAPHFPIQARPVDIAKYRGKYLKGWDALREERYLRQIKLGIIQERAASLSDRDPNAIEWARLSHSDRDQWDLKMAVYAAMIDRMDQGIGRILGKIKELGIAEDTVILFLSDNGACAEDYRAFQTTAPHHPPGPMESYRTQEVPWANASNTPFRKYKWWLHEGGIASPLIAYWPGRIKAGRITSSLAHIMDLMPTCLEIAGTAYPNSHLGQKLIPLEGRSLLPIFLSELGGSERTLYWQFGQSRAIRKGDWKLVANPSNPRLGVDFFKLATPGTTPWELYNLAKDRSEEVNLATRHRNKVNELDSLFTTWAARMKN